VVHKCDTDFVESQKHLCRSHFLGALDSQEWIWRIGADPSRCSILRRKEVLNPEVQEGSQVTTHMGAAALSTSNPKAAPIAGRFSRTQKLPFDFVVFA